MILIPSESRLVNLYAITALSLSVILSLSLIRGTFDNFNTFETANLRLADSEDALFTLTEDQLPESKRIARPPAVFKTYTPSTAPVVQPPTTTNSPLPSDESKVREKDRYRKYKEGLSCSPFLNNTDPMVLDPRDKAQNPLPKCEDENLIDTTGLGSYPERGYYSTVEECSMRLDNSDYEISCVTFSEKSMACSYSADGRLCRCGGLPMKPGFCVTAKRMKFHYQDNYDESNGVSQQTCTPKTEWKNGTFKQGRYFPPGNCSLLDINPRAIVKRFPNKWFLFDGDSHQEDKFWGFVYEMRNLRLIALTSYTDRFSRDIRYEVTEKEDLLEQYYLNTLDLGKDDIRKCKIASPCTVFLYRSDRVKGEYVYTMHSIKTNLPDYYVGAWMSRTYTTNEDSQEDLKALWHNAISNWTKPISMAWTSFPYNAHFIMNNVSTWMNDLNYPNLKHHIGLTEIPFWEALSKSKGEPGKLTFDYTWHDHCRVKETTGSRPYVDQIFASELCVAPIPKTMYRIFISLFAIE